MRTSNNVLIACLLPALLVGAFLLGLKQIADVDALLHLVMGKLFVATRSFRVSSH